MYFMLIFNFLCTTLFNHILCELNAKVDEYSKEALSLPIGAMGLYELLDKEETNSMEFQFQLFFVLLLLKIFETSAC
jgi:hypothetical protein